MSDPPDVSPADLERANELIARQRQVWAEMTAIDTTTGDGVRWRELRGEMHELMDEIAALRQVVPDPPP